MNGNGNETKDNISLTTCAQSESANQSPSDPISFLNNYYKHAGLFR